MTPAETLEAVIARGNRTLDMAEILAGRGFGPNWFRLASGEVLSAVAGGGTFCTPRDGSGPFSAVEVWFAHEDEPRSIDVEDLRAFIAEHGGVVAVGESQSAVAA